MKGKVICENCGESNSVNKKFCGECGNVLPEQTELKSEKKGWSKNQKIIVTGVTVLLILSIVIPTSIYFAMVNKYQGNLDIDNAVYSESALVVHVTITCTFGMQKLIEMRIGSTATGGQFAIVKQQYVFSMGETKTITVYLSSPITISSFSVYIKEFGGNGQSKSFSV